MKLLNHRIESQFGFKINIIEWEIIEYDYYLFCNSIHKEPEIHDMDKSFAMEIAFYTKNKEIFYTNIIKNQPLQDETFDDTIYLLEESIDFSEIRYVVIFIYTLDI